MVLTLLFVLLLLPAFYWTPGARPVLTCRFLHLLLLFVSSLLFLLYWPCFHFLSWSPTPRFSVWYQKPESHSTFSLLPLYLDALINHIFIGWNYKWLNLENVFKEIINHSWSSNMSWSKLTHFFTRYGLYLATGLYLRTLSWTTNSICLQNERRRGASSEIRTPTTWT